MAIQIVVNGEEKKVPIDLNVTRLLLHLGLDPARVPVELNREIVRKAQWDTTAVADGARLEIVQFVGGG